MIILDTNVLGALMRIAPEAPVVAWLDRQPAVVPPRRSGLGAYPLRRPLLQARQRNRANNYQRNFAWLRRANA
jgi:predicted nucleic acid-binding protein